MTMKLLLLDTETTDSHSPRVIQFAYKRLDSVTLEAEGAKSFYCKPPVPITFGAMAVHHITNERVANEPPFSLVLGPVQAMVNECVVVAHNAQFDMTALRNEGIDFTPEQAYICTYKVAAALFPELEQHKLQYLRYALGVDRPEFHEVEAHDAMADVDVLEAVFMALLWKLLETVDVATGIDQKVVESAIRKMHEISSKPILLARMQFGKHKGLTFEEIRLKDTGYLRWLLDSETAKPREEQNENLVYTLRHWMK